MIAMNLLDFSYDALTVLMYGILAAITIGCVWLAYEFARARTAVLRDERVFAHPSNITVLPNVRPFDFEVDA